MSFKRNWLITPITQCSVHNVMYTMYTMQCTQSIQCNVQNQHYGHKVHKLNSLFIEEKLSFKAPNCRFKEVGARASLKP